MSLEILLYNKVELDDGSQGVVRYIGAIMGKKGVFYGVDITKGDAKNDGTFKNIKYFDTKKGTRTGRFCKENKIVKCKKTTFSKYPFKFGDIVMCSKTKCKGIIKYIGVPSWVKGGKVYYGLQLNKKKGTCNGTNQGIQYFETKKQYGIYVPVKFVKKVSGGKKEKKEDEEDVKEAMRDYYKSKPEAVQKRKSKKKIKIKAESSKKKAINKKSKMDQLPAQPMYTEQMSADSLGAPIVPLHDQTASIDYMDEEKDGIDVIQYQHKTEEMDYAMSEKQRREQNEIKKQIERSERLQREQDKKQKLKQRQDREKAEQELLDKQNAEKEQELAKREKELRDKERLEKYAQAMQEKEEAEKIEKENQEKAERMKQENAMRKKEELQEKKAKEDEEKKEREQQQKLAEKLRNEREEKQSQSGISQKSGGSIKDRMAMFQKQSNNTAKNTAVSPVKSVANEPEQKKQYVAAKNNVGSVGVQVGSDKAINFEMQNALGKALKTLKMSKVSGYSGEIPLILYLLGEKLIKLDKFGTFKIFHPEEMQKCADVMEMQYANHIYVFFASLPSPLLSTVSQSILMKALSKDVMAAVVAEMDEPYASTLTYLWDILARVAMKPSARMGGQSLGKVFGPMCTMITQSDMKGNRVSGNALAASRMMSFFRRGIEWRMEVQGYNFDDSDESD